MLFGNHSPPLHLDKCESSKTLIWKHGIGMFHTRDQTRSYHGPVIALLANDERNIYTTKEANVIPILRPGAAQA
jgi:hypothetical protein